MSVASWHWLFLINLPMAVVIIVLSLKLLPSTKAPKVAKFDLPGMLVVASALASFAYGLNQLDTTHFGSSLISAQVAPFLIASLILFGILIPIEKRAANPILPGKLFARKQLGLAYTISAGAGIGEASLVFMPLLAVVALGDFGVTQRSASFLLMPVVLAMMIGSPTVGRLLDKIGSRWIIIFGGSVLAAGMFLLSQFADSLFLFILSGVLVGFGLSALLGAPIRYIMLNEAEEGERSTTQGVASLFTSMGQLLGSAFVGAVAASRAAESPAAGYATAFFFIAMISLVVVGFALPLKTRSQEVADQAAKA